MNNLLKTLGRHYIVKKRYKVTRIFRPHFCFLCDADTRGIEVVYRMPMRGIESQFVFCSQCIDNQPTLNRFTELINRSMGFPDAIERMQEEQRFKRLLEPGSRTR